MFSFSRFRFVHFFQFAFNSICFEFSFFARFLAIYLSILISWMNMLRVVYYFCCCLLAMFGCSLFIRLLNILCRNGWMINFYMYWTVSHFLFVFASALNNRCLSIDYYSVASYSLRCFFFPITISYNKKKLEFPKKKWFLLMPRQRLWRSIILNPYKNSSK